VRLSSFSSKMTNNVGTELAPIHDNASYQHSKRWSHICILCVRIIFGSIWTWNAWLLGHCLTTQAASMYVRQMITASQQHGQHILLWGDFWQNIATQYPVGFILFCVVSVGLVAGGLLCNLFTRLISAIGSILALFFWSTQLVSLVPSVQADDTGVLLVFLLAFLGFILVAVSSPHAQYHYMNQKKGANQSLSFVPANVDTAHGTIPEQSRSLAQRTSFAATRTRVMNESGIPRVRRKEVVGANTSRSTSNNN
jgi:hypothetical protein